MRAINFLKRGTPRTKETKEKIKLSLLGKKRPPLKEETKRKMSEKRTQYLSDPNIREQIRQKAIGRKHTEKSKLKMSIKRRKHLDTHLNCSCITQASPSNLSKKMIDKYLFEFPEVIAEKRFGRFYIDAYIPHPYHLAFEADGKYWHRLHEKENPGFYQRRDIELLSRYNLPVIRLSENEINST